MRENSRFRATPVKESILRSKKVEPVGRHLNCGDPGTWCICVCTGPGAAADQYHRCARLYVDYIRTPLGTLSAVRSGEGILRAFADRGV